MENIAKIDTFLETQIEVFQAESNEEMIARINEAKSKIATGRTELKSAIEAKAECIEAYGPIPERKLIPGRKFNVNL